MKKMVLIAALTFAAPLFGDTLTFKVVGIDCGGCVPPVTKALKKVDGVKSVKVDAKAMTATVDVPADFDREQLRTALANAGFGAAFAGEQARELQPVSDEIAKTLDIASYTDGKRVDFAKITAAGKITIVDFYADWCGPCKVLEARIEHLMLANSDLALRRVNIGKWDNDAAKQATQLHAEELPYIRVYDAHGKFVTDVTGGMWDEVLDALAKAKQ
jgi:copper chaperone CopZ